MQESLASSLVISGQSTSFVTSSGSCVVMSQPVHSSRRRGNGRMDSIPRGTRSLSQAGAASVSKSGSAKTSMRARPLCSHYETQAAQLCARVSLEAQALQQGVIHESEHVRKSRVAMQESPRKNRKAFVGLVPCNVVSDFASLSRGHYGLARRISSRKAVS